MSTSTTNLPGYVASTWTIDPVHSDVAYSVKHLGIAKSAATSPPSPARSSPPRTSSTRR